MPQLRCSLLCDYNTHIHTLLYTKLTRAQEIEKWLYIDIQHIKAPLQRSKWLATGIAFFFFQPFGQVVLGKAGLIVIPLLVALTTLGAANGSIFGGTRYETASMVDLRMMVCIPSLIPGFSMQLLEMGSFQTCLVGSTEHTRHPCLQHFFMQVRIRYFK